MVLGRSRSRSRSWLAVRLGARAGAGAVLITGAGAPPATADNPVHQVWPHCPQCDNWPGKSTWCRGCVYIANAILRPN